MRSVFCTHAARQHGVCLASADGLLITTRALLLLQIVREAYPDHSQFDSSSKYYDASAK